MGRTKSSRKRRRGGQRVHLHGTVSPKPPPESGDRPPIPDIISRLNYRLLGISLLVVIVLAASGFLVHGWQYERNLSQLLQMADQAEKEGDLGLAIRRLSQCLTAQRKTLVVGDELLVVTLTRLAALHQERASNRPSNPWSHLQKAWLYNEEILRLRPDQDETRLEVVRDGLRLRRLGDTLKHIEKLLGDATSTGSSPTTVTEAVVRELHSTRARCSEGLAELAKAQFAWIIRIEVGSDDAEPYIALARLITTHPNALCSRDKIRSMYDERSGDEIPVEPTELAGLLLAGFPQDPLTDPTASIKTAVTILDLMTELAKPTWNAQRQRAIFLTSLSTSQEWSALNKDAASAQSGKLLTDRDGDQNGLLDRAESDHPSVPAFADRDRNGRIDQAELSACLELSLSESRLRDAESSIQAALDLTTAQDDSVALAATLRSAIDVFMAQAELFQYVDPEKAKAYVTRAGDLARRAAELDPDSAQSILLQARLQIQTLGFETNAVVQQQKLNKAEALLRSAYSLVASVDSEMTVEDPGQRTLFNSIASTLADVLLYQIGRQPKEREALLAEVKDELMPAMKSADSPQPMTQFLEGRVQFASGEWVEADRTFQTAASSVMIAPDLLRRLMLMRIECAVRFGNPSARLAHSLALVQLQPSWGPARIAHAEATAAAGQLEEAIRHYSTVGGRADHTPRLTQLLLRRESRRPFAERSWNAVEQALQLMRGQPENAVQQARFHSQLLVEQAKVAQLQHQSEEKQGVSEAAESLLDQANAVLLDAVAKNPDDLDLVVARIRFLVQRFDLTAAERVTICTNELATFREQFGDDVRVRTAAVPAAVLLPAGESLTALLELRPSDDEFTADERAALLKSIARTLSVIGDEDEALNCYVQASELVPNDVAIPLAALQLLVEQDQQQIVNDSAGWHAMMTCLEKIEGAGGPLAGYYKAVRIVLSARSDPDFNPDSDRGPLDEALSLLTQAKRARRDWSAVPTLLGELHTLLGNDDIAYEYFDEAVGLGERDKYVVSKVVRFDLSKNDVPKAQRLLDRIAAEQPQLLQGELGRLAWKVTRTLEDNSPTLSVLRSQTERSGGAAEKILMAMDGIARGNPSLEAERLLEEACASEPENPETWLTLVVYYTRFERTEDALDAISKAEAILSAESPTTAAVTLARCYETLAGGANDRSAEFLDQAKRHYQQAIDANPANSALRYAVAGFYRRHNEPENAVRLLDQLLDPDTEISDDARTQTLIAKALAVAQAGTRADTEQALSMLREAESLDDTWQAGLLRAEATILDRRNGPGDARALLRLLERIAELEPLRPQERLLVAALHDQKMNDWEKAHAQYEQLAIDYPEDTAVLAALVKGLLRRQDEGNNLADAQDYFEQLRRREPDTYRTHMMATRLAAADGDCTDAAAQLVDFLRNQLIEQPATEFIQQIDQNNISEVSQSLSELARAHGDRTALKILSDIKRLAAEGNSKAAAMDLRKLGYAQWLTAEVRVQLLREAARLLEQLDQADLAEPVYRQYGEDSARPQAVLEYVRYLARQERHLEGLKVCEQHWDEIPAQLVARTAIGLLRHGNLGQVDISRIAPRLGRAVAAADNMSEKAELLMLTADLWDHLERYEDVQEVVQSVLELNPDHVIGLNNLAWLLARRGQPERALQLIEHAIEIAGPYPELLDTQGVVLTVAGKATQAVEILSHAVEQRPLAQIYLHLAEAQLVAGNRDAARDALERAVDAGLQLNSLHPLDRAQYDKLSKTLPHQ